MPIIPRPKTIFRNDPCPCGSGKPAKTCCLLQDGTIFKAPRQMSFGLQSKKHPKCYLRNLGGCGAKLTNEHLISEAVDTKPTGKFFFDGKEVSGPAPLAVEAKVLCDKHNAEYGAKIDETGIKYCDFFGEVFTNNSLRNLIISGHDLESYLIQRLCVHHFGKLFSFNEKSLKDAFLDMAAVERALTLNEFSHGGGLYITLAPPQSFQHPSTIERAAIYSPNGNEIVGIRFTVQEVSVALLLHNKHPLTFPIWGYRPKGFQMVFPDGKASTIHLSWLCGAKSPMERYYAVPKI